MVVSMLATLLVTSCAESATDDTPPFEVSEGAQFAGDFAEVGDGSADAGDDICEHLPCDGACSLACDYDALVDQYVPPNTCASFVCELDDGRTIGLDACN